MAKIVYATASSSVASAGHPVMVRQGSHWRADDPVVVAYPSLFSDDPSHGLSASVAFEDGAGEVEQATAAPGETRRVGRRSE